MAINWNQVQLPSFAASNQIAVQGSDTVMKAIGSLQDTIDLGTERYLRGEQGKLNAFDAALQKMGNEELSTMTEADIVKEFGINDPETMQLALAEQQGRNDMVQTRLDANKPVWTVRIDEKGQKREALVDPLKPETPIKWGNAESKDVWKEKTVLINDVPTAIEYIEGKYDKDDASTYNIIGEVQGTYGRGGSGSTGGDKGGKNQPYFKEHNRLNAMRATLNNLGKKEVMEEITGWLAGANTGFLDVGNKHAGAMRHVSAMSGQYFKDAYEALKGGGSITNIEGLQGKLANNPLLHMVNDKGELVNPLNKNDFEDSLAELNAAIDLEDMYLNYKADNNGDEPSKDIVQQMWAEAQTGDYSGMFRLSGYGASRNVGGNAGNTQGNGQINPAFVAQF